MLDSMNEMLRQDMDCEGLLACFHGFKELDKGVFRILRMSAEPLTVNEIAKQVDCERSTAYRVVQRLLQVDCIQKEQINYDQGGYYHVYQPTNPNEIADDMQQMLNEWYAKIGQLIQEFRDKYDKPAEQSVTAHH